MRLPSRLSPAALARSIAIALLLGAGAVRAAEPTSTASPVRIIAERSPGRFGGITYRYVVINNATAPITTILIGFDEPGDRLELTVPPYGSTPEETPATSATGPVGWTFFLTRTEQDTLFNLHWEIEDAQRSLWPGSRLSDLSVTVPREDPLYETGHWLVIFGRNLQSLSGTLERSRRKVTNEFSNDPDIWVRPDAAWVSALIEYKLDAAEDADVAILGEGGRLVRRLFHDQGKQGRNKVTWNALDDERAPVPPGVYFIRVLTAGGERVARFSWRK